MNEGSGGGTRKGKEKDQEGQTVGKQSLFQMQIPRFWLKVTSDSEERGLSGFATGDYCGACCMFG